MNFLNDCSFNYDVTKLYTGDLFLHHIVHKLRLLKIFIKVKFKFMNLYR